MICVDLASATMDTPAAPGIDSSHDAAGNGSLGPNADEASGKAPVIYRATSFALDCMAQLWDRDLLVELEPSLLPGPRHRH
jgi:hypothetical protein